LKWASSFRTSATLEPQGDSDAHLVNEGFILGIVVGRLVVDMQDVLQVIALKGR
jgi:hypothetical protein